MIFTHHIDATIEKEENVTIMLSRLPVMLFHFNDNLVDLHGFYVIDIDDKLVLDAEAMRHVLVIECLIFCTLQAVFQRMMHLLG